jgi:hypothetical protein
MNVEQMIKVLRTEADALDAAIAVLQRLAVTQKRRRGRPPSWLQGDSEETVSTRGPRLMRKRVMSEETRKKMAEAQKKRWAAYRKERQG